MNLTDMRIESIYLEPFRVCVQNHVSRSLLNYSNLEAKSMIDSVSQDMVLRLEANIASQKVGVLRVPATWWEHFKDTKFPAWAKKRWPIKWTEYQARVLYPNIALPNSHQPYFRFDRIVS